jgi:hypothetical protein
MRFLSNGKALIETPQKYPCTAPNTLPGLALVMLEAAALS